MYIRRELWPISHSICNWYALNESAVGNRVQMDYLNMNHLENVSTKEHNAAAYQQLKMDVLMFYTNCSLFFIKCSSGC